MDTLIKKMLASHRIAVVGVSDDRRKPSHAIARYLMDAGYEVFPVNPTLVTVLGIRCYPSISDVPPPIDLVNVFRRPEFIPGIVAEAIAIKAGGVWVQSGIRSSAAVAAASSANLDYIEDQCIMIEHSIRLN